MDSTPFVQLRPVEEAARIARHAWNIESLFSEPTELTDRAEDA